MVEVFKATATKIDGGMQVEAGARNFKLLLDEPPELGGLDKGITPPETLLCALAACQTIVGYAFAAGQGIQLEGFTVEIEGDLDPDGFQDKAPVRNGFSEIRFKMHMKTDASQEQAEAYAQFIQDHCPVGDSIANGVKLVCSGVVLD